MKTKKPIPSLYVLIQALYDIYLSKKCPRCKNVKPYYLDCCVCHGYVMGCDLLPKEDALIKYVTWLKEDFIA